MICICIWSVHIFGCDIISSPGTEPRDHLKRCQRGITWQEYFSFWCDCKTCSSSCGQKLLGTVDNTNVFHCHWHHKTNGATHVNVALTCGRTVLVTSFFRSYLHTMTTILFRRQVSDLAKQITMFIMVKATFCWPKLAFRGPQCWKLHKCCRLRKRQRGMLGSLLSAFFHQELRITPEPFWTLSWELISRTSQNFHLMPYRVPWLGNN